MKIVDFETNKNLTDVALYLSKDEASALLGFLKRLVEQPEIHKVYLSDITSFRLEREFTVALDAA